MTGGSGLLNRPTVMNGSGRGTAPVTLLVGVPAPLRPDAYAFFPFPGSKTA
ncbi:MAG TPA: hypothetical protein VNG93_14290 [Candidatus Dormibacteraeota bacterium]|nr:hypothetical protein [Candidatus Dormibacteraeota bacterium]